MSLPESLERAASELGALADQIRPANGDPHRLLEELGPEEAGRLLAWMLNEAVDDAPPLLDAWGEADAGVAILVAQDEAELAKPGRKLLRKALHRLRSQGIAPAAVPTRAPEPRRAVLAAEERFQAAHVSTPDYRGARMAYLVEGHPSRGARLFEVRFDERRGILDFKVYNAPRSKVRGFLKSLTAGSEQRLFEVDRDAARALVWRASQAQPTDRPLPTAFVEWRSRLFPDELEKEATPGDRVRETLEPVAGEASTEAVAGRIEAGVFGPWPPSPSWVTEQMERGRACVEGREGTARGEAIEGWIDEVSAAIGELLDRAWLVRQLEELAWVRWQAGDENEAQALLGVAAALPDDETVARAIDRARVVSLFEPFLAELRVVESVETGEAGVAAD
jgi:hypothetical protein